MQRHLVTFAIEIVQQHKILSVMNQVITSQEAEQAIEKIIKRAQIDPEFRQLCINKPNDAAIKATEKELPDGFTLRFVENHNADLTVVLPDMTDVNVELSDAELEQVAGGGSKEGRCGGSCGVSHNPEDFNGLDIKVDVNKK